MSCFLTWLSVSAIAYSYFGYPLVLCFFLLFKREKTLPKKTLSSYPSFSIVVAVQNEENSVEQKIKSSLATIQKYKNTTGAAAELVIVSDSSEDQTESIVTSYLSPEVRLIASLNKAGKDRALNLAIKQISSEILFFTDVRCQIDEDALLKLVKYFNNPKVGAVSTQDRIFQSGANTPIGSGESLYVRYEMFLRRLESKFNSLVSLSGSGFAIRRELCSEIDKPVTSDFAFLFECQKNQKIALQANDIDCYYPSLETEEAEFHRKIRTVLHGMNTFFSYWNNSILLKNPIFAWQLLSHKLCRWLVPFFLILFSFTIPQSMWITWEYFALACLALIFLSLALVGYLYPSLRTLKVIKLPLFFLSANLAILIAWIKLVRKEKINRWTPSGSRPTRLA